MNLILLQFHIIAFIRKCLFKLIYRSKIKFGDKTTFRKGFTLLIEDNGKLTIGHNCFFNNYCTIAAKNTISIGNGTLFGENVKIYDHNHSFNDISIPIKEQGYTSAPIVIGNHCWIASNVVILKGVTIGDNCVVGAGCIIYKDIPDNTIVKNQQQLSITHLI